jgi:DNA-binding XRE family transcriptional regulator
MKIQDKRRNDHAEHLVEDRYESGLLTPEKWAARLHVTKLTLLKWAREKRIESITISRKKKTLFSVEAIFAQTDLLGQRGVYIERWNGSKTNRSKEREE